MTKPKWIVFDVGGVLLDWHASSQHVADYLHVSKSKLFDTLFDQSVPESIGDMMNVGKLSTDEGWTTILERLDVHNVAPDDVVRLWVDQAFWYVPSLQLIRYLKEAGYPLAIMSNSWMKLTDPSMEAVFPQELQLFDTIFDSSIEKNQKPDIGFFRTVETRLGVSGDDIYFIDDDQKNIATAKDIGWQTFLFVSSGGQVDANCKEIYNQLIKL